MQIVRLRRALVLALLVAAVPATVGAFGRGPEAELEEADKALGTAWQKRDLDRLVEFYADDAKAAWTGEPVRRGKAELREFWRRTWADPNYGIVAGERDVFVVAASGDLAVMQGTSTFRRSGPAGPVEVRGSWTSVWRRIDGRWKISSDSWNMIEEVKGSR